MNYNELVILGLLMEGPRHGYDLKQLIEKRAMGKYINLATSSMYKTLNRLEAAGDIKARSEKVGSRPERQVYQVTPQGEEKLKELIQKALYTTEPYYDPLNAALTFAQYIPRDAVITALQKRKQTSEQAAYYMQEILERLQAATKQEYGVDPFYAQAILKYGIKMMDAAEEWLAETIRDLERKDS